jgi:hypothetical protein
MSGRTPPALALWLLARCGSGAHAQALAGDVIELYQHGRSRGWLWRQVAMALGVTLLRSIRTMPWMIVLRASLRLTAEAAAVLAIAIIVDQSRRTQVSGATPNLAFIVTVAALITVALFAILALMGTQSMTTRRQGPAEALAGVLMLAFGVIALGSGALTRADTTHGGADDTRSRGGQRAECNCR